MNKTQNKIHEADLGSLVKNFVFCICIKVSKYSMLAAMKISGVPYLGLKGIYL
jgi:hypothetical protein